MGSRSPKLSRLTPFRPPPPLQGSKESLRAEAQNISSAFKDLDGQVSSETGYTPEEATGSEETAQGLRTHRAMAFRHHISTQKMYEMKTKLRCSSEGCPRMGQGGAGHRARLWGPPTALGPPHRCGEPGHTQLPPLV